MSAYDNLDFSRALEAIWSIIATVDKFIVERAPWKLAKDQSEGAPARLDETLYTAAEALRIVCVLASPVLPHSTQAIWQQLGFSQPVSDARSPSLAWGGLPSQQIGTIAAVFPRLDAATTIKSMQDLEETEKGRQAALMGNVPGTASNENAPVPIAPEINIDDFGKVDLRVGEVKSAESVKGADKLLHL